MHTIVDECLRVMVMSVVMLNSVNETLAMRSSIRIVLCRPTGDGSATLIYLSL